MYLCPPHKHINTRFVFSDTNLRVKCKSLGQQPYSVRCRYDQGVSLGQKLVAPGRLSQNATKTVKISLLKFHHWIASYWKARTSASFGISKDPIFLLHSSHLEVFSPQYARS